VRGVLVCPSMDTKVVQWSMRQWAAVAAIAAAVALGSASPRALQTTSAPAARTVLVKAAQIIDGRGGAPLRNGAVLIRGDRIERIGPAAGMTADRTIDLGSATVLPGLIDLHTHLTDEVGTNWESALLTTTPGRAAIYGAVNARTTLMAGFTTARDMGPTWPYTDIDLRYAIDKGSVPGPRLQVAGNYVSATGGAGDARQFSIYVDVPIVRNLADGVDEVRRVTRTNLKNGADFIKILATGAVMSKGIPPAAHAHGAEGIKAAVRAGVRTIDHGSMLDEEGARLMKEKGTFFAPTLYVGHAILNDNQTLNIPAHQGQSPMAAIEGATRIAAEAMGWSDRVGTLQAGRFADLIAVDKDPLADISELERVQFVMKGGLVHKTK